MTLLEAEDLTKYYGEFCALAGVSLAVSEGEFVSIIGPNGAGKTTLVNLLSGLFEPTSGTIRLKGRNIAGIGPVRLAELGLARSFQLVNIFPHLTVRETIAASVVSRLKHGSRLFTSVTRDREVMESVEHTAALFDLKDQLDHKATTLPQGGKKLLDVASAFALHPEIILLDEPTSGVSTANKNKIMETLIQAAERMGVKAIIQVEHDMDLVFRYSDRIIAVHQGRVLKDATPDDIRADEDVVATVMGKRIERCSA